MGYLGKLKNLIRFAKITGPSSADDAFPVQQMSYKGKVVNVLQIFPYAIFSNISNDDSLGVMFSVDGSESNRAAISFTPNLRPQDLEQNETAFYHPYTKTFIKLRNNGDLEITTNEEETQGNVIINCISANINAEEEVNVNCADATISASNSATVDSPETTITGNLTANGTTSLNGGPAIARVGDTVQVNITSGSSSGVYNGTITSGGSNTSA